MASPRVGSYVVDLNTDERFRVIGIKDGRSYLVPLTPEEDTQELRHAKAQANEVYLIRHNNIKLDWRGIYAT